MLNIHKASIFFQGEPLFSDITFRLGNGNRVGLIGKNGAGKSTLLKVISGEIEASSRWAFVFHTIFIWIMYVLMFYVTSLSMQEFNNISFAPILIGFILGMFSIGATNGGIGTYPEAVVIAFSLFSIAEDPSRAFGWIMWSSQTIMIIIFGGISLLLLPIYNNHRNKSITN